MKCLLPASGFFRNKLKIGKFRQKLTDFCLKEQHLIQVGGNKAAARTQYKVFNAVVFLLPINILYFHPLKMHTPNL